MKVLHVKAKQHEGTVTAEDMTWIRLRQDPIPTSYTVSIRKDDVIAYVEEARQDGYTRVSCHTATKVFTGWVPVALLE